MNRQISRKVDRVFDLLASNKDHDTGRLRKKRRLDSGAAQPGGFVVDDDTLGGFIVDDIQPSSDASEPPEETDTIQFNKIPDALQLLDLPPDDAEVLSVFRNAASGWSGGNAEEIAETAMVTRNDFRSVCLVLLGGEDGDQDVDEELTSPLAPTEEIDGASDVYREPSFSSLTEDEEDQEKDDDDDDDEDYEPVPQSKSPSKGRRKKGKRGSQSETDEDFSEPRQLSRRQKEVSLDSFQLFFPTVKRQVLPSQRIFLKDLIRVAESLREKIKSDDVSFANSLLLYSNTW